MNIILNISQISCTLSHAGGILVGMNTQELETYKVGLEGELVRLEGELKTVGRPNPDTKGDWEATVTDADSTATEPDELDDRAEEAEENQGILDALEISWRNTKRALAKVAAGTYGTCEVCSAPIETARLQANPIARTCETHMAQEESLAK